MGRLQLAPMMLSLTLVACSLQVPYVPGLLSTIEHEPIPVSEKRLGHALALARRNSAEQKKHARYPSRVGGHSSRRMSDYVEEYPSLLAKAKESMVWLDAAKVSKTLSHVPAESSKVSCPEETPPNCDFTSKYRRIDGACNHPTQPTWGASETASLRLRGNSFNDGIDEPRNTSISGRQLASPRKISQTVIGAESAENTNLTLSVVNWGQFLDHDLTLTPFFLAAPGRELVCCNADGPHPQAHPQCLTIEIPEDDPFFSIHGRRCMEFARSMPAEPASCKAGARLTKNLLTSYLDASGVYGSTTRREEALRVPGSFLLKTQLNGKLLPADPPGVQSDEEALCFSEDLENQPCFLAGDVRATEQSGLSVLHIIWVKQHNRVAEQLAVINQHWSNETVFQETRRIIIAQIQHITYGEWLPRMVGEQYMFRNQIDELIGGRHSKRYQEQVNPSISLEFSTAAFRVGHTLLQGNLKLYRTISSPPQTSDISQRVNLRDMFFNPKLLYDGHMDELAKGMLVQHPQVCDANIVEDVTKFLFKEPERHFGMDLISMNIQRGRDHGIPTYNSMREACGLKRAATFEDLKDHIPDAVIDRLKLVYDDVQDIDLFIGAVSERPVEDAAVGPTIRCIVGDQFIRLRWGDSHFYDLGQRHWRFSRQQLIQIRRTTWAGILCHNVDTLARVQGKAFEAASYRNPVIDCDQIRKMKLGPWRE